MACWSSYVSTTGLWHFKNATSAVRLGYRTYDAHVDQRIWLAYLSCYGSETVHIGLGDNYHVSTLKISLSDVACVSICLSAN